MLWKLTQHPGPKRFDEANAAGRYVLHRHTDADGEHLDLRLECDGYLIGWRIDSDRLDGEPLATEKPPHAIRWLEYAENVEASGRYAIERNTQTERIVHLETDDGALTLRFALEHAITPAQFRALTGALDNAGVPIAQAGALLADGVTARHRAIERLCGLGRELDGEAFDVELWRKTLHDLTLDEIHAQLRTFEARFDQKYPPRPISRPERLDDNPRAETALEIARS